MLHFDEREREARLERSEKLSERVEYGNGAKPDLSGCSELAMALMRRAYQLAYLISKRRVSAEFVARDFQRIIEEHGI